MLDKIFETFHLLGLLFPAPQKLKLFRYFVAEDDIFETVEGGTTILVGGSGNFAITFNNLQKMVKLLKNMVFVEDNVSKVHCYPCRTDLAFSSSLSGSSSTNELINMFGSPESLRQVLNIDFRGEFRLRSCSMGAT